MSAAAATVLAALALGVGVPWLAMRALMPSLTEVAVHENFRGRPVAYGLSVAWFVWAGCALAGGALAAAFLPGSVLPILSIAGLLAVIAFCAGLVDDALGSSTSKGFRGHLGALARGRLTTGGLKLLSIGAASLVCGLSLGSVAPWAQGGWLSPVSLAGAVLAGGAIALTANLMNLMDLRPGRALKAYVVLALAGTVSTGVMLVRGPADGILSASLPDTVALALYLAGPALAVAPYDLGERAMLGDAGANPMGAVAGLMIVAGLPLWGLVAYTALVFALNIVSERVSFSRIIEGNAILRRIDRMGRSGDGPL